MVTIVTEVLDQLENQLMVNKIRTRSNLYKIYYRIYIKYFYLKIF